MEKSIQKISHRLTAALIICALVFANVMFADAANSTGSGTAIGISGYSTTPESVTVTFDVNGGILHQNEKASKTVVYGEKYGQMPIPERQGYVFAGWHTKTYGGARIMENNRVRSRIDVSLHAKWKLKAIYVNPEGLPILMYHWFYDKAAGGKSINGNWLEINAFEAQLRYLTNEKYAYPSWHEVEAYITYKMTLPDKSIVLTDDDGNDSFFKLAYPLIEKYDVDVTEFLITSVKGGKTMDEYNFDGVHYRSHTHNMHRRGGDNIGVLLHYDHDTAYTDLRRSVAILGASEVMAYPFGNVNDAAKTVVSEAGFRMAVTTVPRIAYPGDKLLALPRVRVSEGESLKEYIKSLGR